MNQATLADQSSEASCDLTSSVILDPLASTTKNESQIIHSAVRRSCSDSGVVDPRKAPDVVAGKDTSAKGDSASSTLCNCMMFAFLTFCYIFVSVLPHSAILTSQLNSQTSVGSSSNIPSDGPSTIYQAAKPSGPFFPTGSTVYDSYNGELKLAAKLVEQYGYVFVMYYASWSTSSRQARGEFEKAAEIMQGRVPFVAINCWYPSSQCKSKYKFYSFPSFFVYASGMKMGFAFSGVEKSHYFVRFIQSLLNPITHISNATQFLNFVSNQESSLVGYFNLSKPEPAGKFQQFYYASLRSIEKDYIQPVRFGVVSDEQFASQYSMNEEGNILLIRSVQDNLAYPSTGNFTSTAITKWVNKYRVKPLVSWLFPQGKKSDTLYKILESGPTAILLTPYDACSLYNNDLSLLREVILDMYSCNKTAARLSKISTLIAGSIRLRSSDSESPICLVCNNIEEMSNSDCCYSLANSSSLCQVCAPQKACGGHCHQCKRAVSAYHPQSHSNHHNISCFSMKQDITTSNIYTEICCQSVEENSTHRRSTDGYIRRHRDCVPVQYISSQHQPSKCLTNIRLSNESSICSSNTTLNVLAVDSSLYTELGKRFGVDSNMTESRLVLVNLEDESYYIMGGRFNKSNIVKFLEEYTSGMAHREQPSAPIPETTPHLNPVPHKQETFYIKDINASHLTSVLSTQNIFKKDVVVLFYSKWCTHCKALAHIFLSCANHLRGTTSIKFFRLDMATNTLEWKHMVSQVPTVTLFPYSGHAEKITLPLKSSGQMLQFILERCSVRHVIEVITKSTELTPKILNLLRSRITSLERQLLTYRSYNTKEDEFIELIKRNIRTTQFNLLKLRKLYIHIYGTTWLYGNMKIIRQLRLFHIYY